MKETGEAVEEAMATVSFRSEISNEEPADASESVDQLLTLDASGSIDLPPAFLTLLLKMDGAIGVALSTAGPGVAALQSPAAAAYNR